MTRDLDATRAVADLRLFVALPVPAAAAAAIHDALAAHRATHPQARWLDPRMYHVTLRFLGQADGSLLPSLADAVAGCAATTGPFAVTAGRGGGARGRSEVAWLDILDGRDRIDALADRLDGLLPATLRARLRPGRPAPHLTVARRAPAELAVALARDGASVPWVADRVVLFRSHTGTPAGSRYEPLVEAPLGGVPA